MLYLGLSTGDVSAARASQREDDRQLPPVTGLVLCVSHRDKEMRGEGRVSHSLQIAGGI